MAKVIVHLPTNSGPRVTKQLKYESRGTEAQSQRSILGHDFQRRGGRGGLSNK
jgi:hypothetical protein